MKEKIKIFFQKIITAIFANFEKLQGQKISATFWIGSFLGINALRIFVEFILVPKIFNSEMVLIEYVHNLFFFGMIIVLIWLSLSFILKINPNKLAYFMAIFQWIIIFPPILDMLKTGGQVYWSFYALTDFAGLGHRFATFFGDMPAGIVYFGTGFAFIAFIVFSSLIVFLASKSYFKALFGAFLVYCLIFLMGIFPSLITFFYYFFTGTRKLWEIQDFHAMELLASRGQIFGVKFALFPYFLAYNLNLIYFILLIILLTILFFALDKAKFIGFIYNLRLPQVIFHLGFLGVGLGLGFLAYPENFALNFISVFAFLSLIIAVFLAWEASVVVNDIYDFQVDAVSNPNRPLQKGTFSLEEYRNFGFILFFLSLLGGIAVGLKFMIFLLIYQLVAWFYSAPPFRLKRIPLVASFLSSFALLVILFMGFILFSGDYNLYKLSWRIILLLLMTFTLALPLKDFKDIAGDQQDGLWTIPVIFGEKMGKIIIGSGIFISFMASVFILNELRLFWWALIFGSGAFILVTNKEIKNTKIFWWIMGVILIYLLILVRTIFIK